MSKIVKTSWSIPGTSIGAEPEFFSAWTLYDIGLDTVDGKKNCQKIVNIITGRGQYLLAGVDRLVGQDIDDSIFGATFCGMHTVWCLKWIANAIGNMTEASLCLDSSHYMLQNGLNETADLPGQIITIGPLTNTFFTRHDSF